MKQLLFTIICLFIYFNAVYTQKPINEAFLLNDDTTGITVKHGRPSVAISNDGKKIVVWHDGRNVTDDIYMQLFSETGSPIGNNVKVNTDTNRVNHSFPQVAVDSRGFFGITWNDERNGTKDVFFQMFDSTGERIGQNTQINEIPGRNRYALSIDCDSLGNYVVAWENRQLDVSAIYYQRIDLNGFIVGNNIIVSNDERPRGYPNISILNSDELVIIWQEKINDDYDIFLQKFSAENMPISSSIMVNDSSYASQRYADIVYSNSGNIFAVWVDSRDTSTYSDDIYCQIFDELGNKVGNNFIINDDTLKAGQANPKISSDKNGKINIVWTDYRNYQGIYLQQLNENGSFIRENLPVYDENSSYDQFSQVSTNDSGFISVVFESKPLDFLYYPNIFMQQLSPSLEKIGDIIQVNDDYGTVNQSEISISINKSGAAVASWKDARNGTDKVFFQKFSSTNGLMGKNIQAPDTLDGDNVPSIIITEDNEIHLVWEVYRPYVPDVYYQRYNSNVLRDGSLKNVTDKDNNSHWEPEIVVDSIGNSYIVWEDGHSNANNIALQRYDQWGYRIGNYIYVNDSAWTYKYNPDIAISSNGYIIVVWGQSKYEDGDIFGQWFNTEGMKIGGNFKISESQDEPRSFFPVVAMDDNDRAVVAWIDYRDNSEYYNIYLQQMDPRAGLLGENKKISKESVGYRVNIFEPAEIASSPDGKVIIVWHQIIPGSIGSGIIGQILTTNGILWGDNFHIVNSQYRIGTALPVVAANSDQIVYAWQDSRRSKGWDVYTKFDTWEAHDINNLSSNKTILESFRLYQNYPNPFNPITNISFFIPKTEFVEIDIFNIVGQSVKSFVKKKYVRGTHQIIFDGSLFASGIYFVQMKAGNFTNVKKMVLIR